MSTPNPWQEAVIDQLICLHIYQAKHDTDPRLALNEVINYHVQLALDPQVSSSAQELIDRGAKCTWDKVVSRLTPLRVIRKMWNIEEVLNLLRADPLIVSEESDKEVL